MRSSMRASLALTIAAGLTLAACGPSSDSTNDAPTIPEAPKPKASAELRRPGMNPEPEPDMTLPLAHEGVTPPDKPDLPDSAIKHVNRTGIYGGTVVYAFLGEMESFNPVEPKGTTAQELRALPFNSLLAYNNGKWEVEPELATHWEVKDDQKTWTFHIRRGVRWNDGEPLTMKDVALSFDAIFDDRYQTSAKDGFRDTQGNLPTFTIDEAANTITLVSPSVDSQFLVHVGNVSIIPAHKWQESYEDGTLMQQMTNDMEPADLVGTGPFMLKQYVPAEKVEYVRNPYFWKEDARGNRLPYLDRVIIALVKDNNLKWQKFEAGEHDLFMTFPVDHFREADAMEKKGDTRFIRLGVALRTTWFSWNLHPGQDPDTGEHYVDPDKLYWFSNLEFRRAMNHAIDRDGVVRAAFQGRGSPIWTSFTPGNRSWHNPDVRQYPYDPDKANTMLDALGWVDQDGDGVREDDKGNTIEFQLSTNVENNVRQQVGSLIQKYFGEVGVKVNFKPITFNDLVTSLRDSHAWETMILGWGSGVPPDPANGKNITTSSGRLHVWHPQQPEPATEWEARIDELMGMMDLEFDNAVRKTYNDEIQALVAENCPIYYLVADNSYALAKPGIGNLWPSLLRPEVSWNLDELYWKPGTYKKIR